MTEQQFLAFEAAAAARMAEKARIDDICAGLLFPVEQHLPHGRLPQIHDQEVWLDITRPARLGLHHSAQSPYAQNVGWIGDALFFMIVTVKLDGKYDRMGRDLKTVRPGFCSRISVPIFRAARLIFGQILSILRESGISSFKTNCSTDSPPEWVSISEILST